jgi:hypothetical protein
MDSAADAAQHFGKCIAVRDVPVFEFREPMFTQASKNVPAALMRPGRLRGSPFGKRRAQGMPDADTHPLPCVQMVESTHASRHRYAEHSGIPCAMVYGLYVLSPVSGLFSHRRPAIRFTELDPSVGGSGPHDFAVRADIARLATPTRPPHPVPTSVAIGETPLSGRIRMRIDKHIFRKNGR